MPAAGSSAPGHGAAAGGREAAAGPLMMLAFDHRSVLQRLYLDWRPGGLPGPTVAALKDMVAEALLQARDRISALGGRPALLIDELTGARAGARARAAGVVLAVPIEVSGAPAFALEYGAAFLEHLDSYPADYAKALVFLNPAERGQGYRAQLTAVSAAFRSIREAGHQTLLEIVVPPAGDQLARVGGDQQAFDARIRPALVCQVIEDCYAADIDPDLWKLEGLESADSYQMVSATVRQHSATARCLVLGRGMAGQRVARWLRLAAAQPEFAGFAIGRTIWQDAIGGWIRGDTGWAAAVGQIADQYSAFAGAYSRALADRERA